MRFAWRNRAMLRCAKISQYKKLNPGLRNTKSKSLSEKGKDFVFYKTQEDHKVF